MVSSSRLKSIEFIFSSGVSECGSLIVVVFNRW